MIEVVGGIIIRRDERQARILLTQRMPGRDFPWHWESPGGKVEGNESHHQALIRELREELGVDLHPDLIAQTPLFHTTIKRDGKEPALVLLYRAYLQPSDEPKPLEGQGIGWFGRAEHNALMLTPGNLAAHVDVDRAMRLTWERGSGDPPSYWTASAGGFAVEYACRPMKDEPTCKARDCLNDALEHRWFCARHIGLRL